MHKLFVTEGIVLQKRGAGEANTLATFLTAELGLVRASARSARVEHSKLRYGLEPLTSGRFSFVQGRREWRLVGAERVSREFLNAPAQRARALGRITRLLLRLVQGEEPLPELYKTVAEGFTYLPRAASDSDAENIECVLVLRILAHLGYLPQTPEITPFLERDFFSIELSAEVARSRALLIRAINESLGATGL
ncbi:MAG: DNA repair protein RecO [bacterium]|nr:DNA repair protein RecO [bacterium]